MKLAVAESVANKLEELNDVLDTAIERGADPTVVAYVPNRHARKRVKRTLHQYPVWVELEIADPEEFET